MEWKCWNIRDETTEALERMLEKTYKDIEYRYSFLRRILAIEDAKEELEIIYRKKSYAADIELELLRRKIYNGTSEKDESEKRP